MDPNNLVCRTCLGIISEGKIAHNIDDENGLIRNVRNIREMIMFCVPEMDIYISISPVICESCLGVLVNVYNFKIRCLRVENAIRSYVMTYNVMEGSCVNLNNVVRQQIVEALKQKNWPSELINDYVDKHLCTVKAPVTKPTGEIFQAMTQNFNAPRLLNNPSPRPLGNSEPPPLVSIGGNVTLTLAPPFEAARLGNPRVPAPGGSGYLSVSKNLMPTRLQSLLTQQSRDLAQLNPASLQSSPPVPMASPPPPGSMPTFMNMGTFQNAFLSALQLTSSAGGGREEAVLVKKKVQKKQGPRKPIQPKSQLGSLNSIPAQLDTMGTNPASTNGDPSVVAPPVLGRKAAGPARKSGLRGVRKSCTSQGRNNNGTGGSGTDDVIILDDDDELETQRVGDELLLINFQEDNGVQGETESTDNNTSDFTKKIFIKLPMIDRETLKRKLTPEDIIDEIQTKRRKMVVRLSPSLPYLHKNKRLLVNVRRDKFYSCMFCMFTTMNSEVLEPHYLTNHRVCALCSYKCDRGLTLSRHIDSNHSLELQEALKKLEERQPEFHCYLCNFVGLSEFDLRDHRLRVHVKCDFNGMYKCPFSSCDQECAISYEMGKHMEKVHDKLRRTQCPLCNYVAPTANALKKHIESHCMTKMKCQYCPAWCKTTFSMKLHVKTKHPSNADCSTTGMAYTVTDQDSSCNDNYRVTLDTLQSRTAEPPQEMPMIESHDQRTLDQYEFALPSLSEILCNQTLSEDASDQEGDCTIVSEDVAESQKPRRARPRGRSIAAKRPSVIVNKKNKKSKESTVAEDPDDCVIIPQEIPTVDLSDDDEVAPSEGKGCPEDQDGTASSSEETPSSSDVIEIEDQNDDCFAVPDVVAVAAESSTQTLRPPDESETEKSAPDESETEKSPQDAGSDISLELPAGAAPSQKTSSENVEDVVEKEETSNSKAGSEESASQSDETQSIVSQSQQTDTLIDDQSSAAKENTVDVVENLEAQKIVEPGSSTDQSADIPTTEAPASENSISATEEQSSEAATDKSRPSSPENTDRGCTSDQSDESKNLTSDPERAVQLTDTSKNTESPEKSDPTTSLCDEGSEKSTTGEPLNDPLSDSSIAAEREEIQPSSLAPAATCLESVLIESSDEDSNDCTFVSATVAPDTAEDDEQETSEVTEEESSNEQGASEAFNSGSDKDNSEESQKKLEGAEKSIAAATDGESAAASEESDECTVSEETNSEETDINKTNDAVSTESDGNVVIPEDPLSSELRQTENQEKTKDMVLSDESELLNTDSEMDSESIEISKSGQKNVETEAILSDVLNTDCDLEDIQSSEVRGQNVVENLIMESENTKTTHAEGAHAELVEKVVELEENVSDVLNADCDMDGIELSKVCEKNMESEDSETTPTESAQNITANAELVEKAVELVSDVLNADCDLEDIQSTEVPIQNVVENLITESEDIDASHAEGDQSISANTELVEKVVESEENVSDVLNADCDMADIEFSEVREKNMDSEDIKSCNTEGVQNITANAELVEKVVESEENVSDVLNADCDMDDIDFSGVCEKNMESQDTETTLTEGAQNITPNAELVEKAVVLVSNVLNADCALEDIQSTEVPEQNVVENLITESEEIETSQTDGDQNITDNAELVEKVVESEENISGVLNADCDMDDIELSEVREKHMESEDIGTSHTESAQNIPANADLVEKAVELVSDVLNADCDMDDIEFSDVLDKNKESEDIESCKTEDAQNITVNAELVESEQEDKTGSNANETIDDEDTVVSESVPSQNLLDIEEKIQQTTVEIETDNKCAENIVVNSEEPIGDCQGEHISESTSAISESGDSDQVKIDLNPEKAND